MNVHHLCLLLRVNIPNFLEEGGELWVCTPKGQLHPHPSQRKTLSPVEKTGALHRDKFYRGLVTTGKINGAKFLPF
jgi:hypothetical protein